MSGLDLSLPEPLGRGKPSAATRAAYEARVAAWCERLLEFKLRIDFDPGARGWCYIMEECGLTKGDFDRAEKLITACRKDGNLPIDFCGEDDNARDFSHIESLDDDDPAMDAHRVVDYVRTAHRHYCPVSFWDFQECYVQMLVEKIGLRNLFDPVCAEYRVPLGNSRGSWSIWQRVRLLARFGERQQRDNRCVLLYCGDHDAHGIRISRSLRSNLEDVLPAFKRQFPEHERFDLDEVEIERFGLNAGFIERHGLTWTNGLITASGKDLGDPAHRKNGDHDVQAYIREFGERKVEADALVTRPQAGRDLCREAILRYVDQDGIGRYARAVLEHQQAMRAELDRLLNGGAA